MFESVEVKDLCNRFLRKRFREEVFKGFLRSRVGRFASVVTTCVVDVRRFERNFERLLVHGIVFSWPSCCCLWFEQFHNTNVSTLSLAFTEAWQ